MIEANSAFSTSSSTSKARIIQLANDAARVRLNEPVRAWRPPVLRRLSELVCLPVGWDGYHGVPVGSENAFFALMMLEVTCPYDAPAPDIVPGSGGDLQIEWHTMTADVELHVRSPNDVLAWRSVGSGGEEPVEIALTNDFTVVACWIKELMGSSG